MWARYFTTFYYPGNPGSSMNRAKPGALTSNIV